MRSERNSAAADIERIERISSDRNNHRPGYIRRDPVGRTMISMTRIERYIKRLFFPEQTQLSGSWPCFPHCYCHPGVNSLHSRLPSYAPGRFPGL